MVKKNLTFMLLAFLLFFYGGETKAEENWAKYENSIISFLYPKDYVISKDLNFLKGTNNRGEEILRITYLNIEKRIPKDIQGYHKTTYEGIKSAWEKRGLNFYETVIGDKKCLVSKYDLNDRKSRFNYIVKHKEYFWTLDYYESKAVKYADIPAVPKKIIESSVVRVNND